ncbi:MAG: ABC transporter permease, partial [Muribaculaceae bacterium]|nr:ABC transporter permease [Muribaculaceae bacterium]
MNILIHNLKVAFRNLRKYKLQTVISVASIAIGIVTLSLTHSFLNNLRIPAFYDQPYRDRAYAVKFKDINTEERQRINNDIIRALKEDNGSLRNAEKVVVPNGAIMGYFGKIYLSDSTIFNGKYGATLIDPEYPEYSGMRSAITGEKIRKLKPGEAIISETYAKSLFKDKNPIGASFRSYI